jgi:hypothetical protein
MTRPTPSASSTPSTTTSPQRCAITTVCTWLLSCLAGPPRVVIRADTLIRKEPPYAQKHGHGGLGHGGGHGDGPGCCVLGRSHCEDLDRAPRRGYLADGTKAGATLTDTATGSTLLCATLMSGALKRGSGLLGADIGSITTAGYDCDTPTTTAHLAPRGLPWHLNLSGYDARTGVSRGTLSHLQLAFKAHGCHAVINGTSGPAANGVVAVTFTNKASSNRASKLTILPRGATLHWYHVHDCAHLAADGDRATHSAAYLIVRRQTITSP